MKKRIIWIKSPIGRESMYSLAHIDIYNAYIKGYKLGHIDVCEDEGWIQAWVVLQKSNRRDMIHPESIESGKSWVEKEVELFLKSITER